MLDLFCGRWGWSKAFAARGWECVGVDLIKPPEIPDRFRFFMGDVLMPGYIEDMIQHFKFDFICASSPCEQFTIHTMRNFHPNPPYPALGIKLFNYTRQICEESGLPYVMENVRAAQQFVGDADNHCGPFYLWGPGVPPIMPQGISKGFGKMDREFILKIGSSKSKKRMEHKAKVATIPPELAGAVADYAERLIEQRASK